MNITVKEAKYLINIVSINTTLTLFAYLLMMKKMQTWQEFVVFFGLMINGFVLARAATKICLPILKGYYEPRYDSKLKNQLWGLFLRVASGLAGLIFAVFILPVTKNIFIFATTIYAIIVLLGYVNDGKTYDKYIAGKTIKQDQFAK